MKKRDKLLLFYLIKDKVDKLFEHIPGGITETSKVYMEIVRYIGLAEELHLDVNELIDSKEYLTMKKYLLMNGYDIDD